MTEIRNSKPSYDLEERIFQTGKNKNTRNSKHVLVFEYCDLRFVCNLVLVIWNLKTRYLFNWFDLLNWL